MPRARGSKEDALRVAVIADPPSASRVSSSTASVPREDDHLGPGRRHRPSATTWSWSGTSSTSATASARRPRWSSTSAWSIATPDVWPPPAGDDARGESEPVGARVLVAAIAQDRAGAGERRGKRRDAAAGRRPPRPRGPRPPSPARCPTRRGRRPAAAPAPSPSRRCRRRGPARAPASRTRPPRANSPACDQRLDHHVQRVAALDARRWSAAAASRRAARGARARARPRRRSEPRPTARRGHRVERARQQRHVVGCRAPARAPRACGSAISVSRPKRQAIQASSRSSRARVTVSSAPARARGPALSISASSSSGSASADAAHPRRQPRPSARTRSPRARASPASSETRRRPLQERRWPRRRASAGEPARPRRAARRRARPSSAASPAACSKSSWALAVAPRRAAMRGGLHAGDVRGLAAAGAWIELGRLGPVIGDQLGELADSARRRARRCPRRPRSCSRARSALGSDA